VTCTTHRLACVERYNVFTYSRTRVASGLNGYSRGVYAPSRPVSAMRHAARTRRARSGTNTGCSSPSANKQASKQKNKKTNNRQETAVADSPARANRHHVSRHANSAAATLDMHRGTMVPRGTSRGGCATWHGVRLRHVAKVRCATWHGVRLRHVARGAAAPRGTGCGCATWHGVRLRHVAWGALRHVARGAAAPRGGGARAALRRTTATCDGPSATNVGSVSTGIFSGTSAARGNGGAVATRSESCAVAAAPAVAAVRE
jgi:hypothetical protein